MFGGDQYDEDYAPHLYYKGKFVGEKKAKKLEERDKTREKTRIRSQLTRLGIGEEFNFEIDDFSRDEGGYRIRDDIIKREKFELAKIHKHYIEVNYKIGLDPHEPTILRQVELARKLVTELNNYGCNQLIELPQRNVVIPKLEEMVKYSKKLIKTFKSE